LQPATPDAPQRAAVQNAGGYTGNNQNNSMVPVFPPAAWRISGQAIYRIGLQ
jgi:hypothetical protein